MQGEITLIKKDSKEYHEFDWFSVSYPDLKTTLPIFQLKYPHGGVPAYALSWGVQFWAWEFITRQEALADPWCKELLEGFGSQTLIGNMVTIELLAKAVNPPSLWPLDPDFIEKIRKGGQPYLFDEILAACLKIEKLAKDIKRKNEKESS